MEMFTFIGGLYCVGFTNPVGVVAGGWSQRLALFFGSETSIFVKVTFLICSVFHYFRDRSMPDGSKKHTFSHVEKYSFCVTLYLNNNMASEDEITFGTVLFF
jgi:hypothetical protein